MIHEPLSLYLRANAGVAAIIGAGAVGRYFEGTLPQKAPGGRERIPGLLLRSIDITDRQVAYCGTVDTNRALVTFDCYDASARGAWLLAGAVRGALLDFRGVMSGTLQVRHAGLDLETELDDPEPGLYRIRQSWAVWFTE